MYVLQKDLHSVAVTGAASYVTNTRRWIPVSFLHLKLSSHQLGRATLAQKSLLQDRLNVAPAVQHAMHVDGRGFEGVNDTVGFEMQFPELRHVYLEEFRGYLATQR